MLEWSALRVVQVARQIFQSGIDSHRCDDVPRPKLLRQAKGGDHVQTGRDAAEGAFLAGQAAGHDPRLALLDRADLIVGARGQERGDDSGSDPLDAVWTSD